LIMEKQNAPYRPQLTIVVRISDYDSDLSLKEQQYYLNPFCLFKKSKFSTYPSFL
jgi:hypothetical protein